MLTRHLAGGGANIAPIATFLNNLKMRANIDAKLTVSYSESIWHIHTEFQRNPSWNVWENDVLVTSCHAISGRKTANFQWLLECRVLKQNASKKTLKDAKLNALRNGYLGLSFFLVGNPTKSKFRFFKNEYLQNQNFQRYPKTGIYSIELYTNYQCTKFEANIFISGCAMAQKTGKGDGVTFCFAFFGISNCHMSK